MKNINRRNFLGTGLAAVASVTVGNAIAGETAAKAVQVKNKNEHPFNERTYGAMPTRSFGKTGYKVGILSLGGQATLEMPGTEDASEKIINRAIDLGVNYIDTRRFLPGMARSKRWRRQSRKAWSGMWCYRTF